MEAKREKYFKKKAVVNDTNATKSLNKMKIK